MNRRHRLIQGAIAAGVIKISDRAPAEASEAKKTCTSPDPEACAEQLAERRRQYAICQERGHVLEVSEYINSIWPPPQPTMTCKWCGTEVWTETIQHERNAPQ